MTSFFDKAFCINLDERPDRWDHIKNLKEFKFLNIERFPAVPYNKDVSKTKIHPTYSKWCHNSGSELILSDGEKSLLQTSYNIWAQSTDRKYTLRMEDDVVFPNYFLDHLKESISFFPKDADIIFLNSLEAESHKHFLQRTNDYFDKFNAHSLVGCYAYIITQEGAKKLVSYINEHGIVGPEDCFLADRKDDLNIYAFKKSMVDHLELEFKSDIKHCGGYNLHYTGLN